LKEITMKPFLLVATGLFLAAATAPAHALMCYGGDESGLQVEFGFRFGQPYTEAEQSSLDVMRLRQAGVDATGYSERWNGCIKAFVRKPGGGEEMQFFEPGSLRRVQ
jgi:hypothetical protein